MVNRNSGRRRKRSSEPELNAAEAGQGGADDGETPENAGRMNDRPQGAAT